MGLRLFPIKTSYKSDIDEPYSDFFIPALKNSNRYWRYGGFFSSKNLALCAEGIQEFLKNSGQILLILSPDFSAEDAIAIKNGVLTPEKFLNDYWTKDLENLQEKIEKDHLRALSWLIAQNPPRLQIKIAIFKDKYSNPLDGNAVQNLGLSHISFGLFHDEEGNAISFKGTIKSTENNETFYNFEVFKNWIIGQKEYVEDHYETFLKYWETEPESNVTINEKNTFTDFEIIDLPKAIHEKFLEISPKDIQEIEILKKPILKPYQNEAVNSFINHGGRGIFQMATGTGKTFCAIASLKRLESSLEKLFVVVVCPTKYLIKQWTSELSKWGYESKNTLSGKEKWSTEIHRAIKDLEYNVKLKQNLVIIITTYPTFSTQEFTTLLKGAKIKTMIIADEVHNAGSETRNSGLLDTYDFRLGLSATPFRYFDDIGTDRILDYFKPIILCEKCRIHNSVVFKFELRDAIPRYLTEYDYFPHYVDLDDFEISEYRKKTQKIAQKISKLKEGKEKDEWLSMLLFERAKIIKNAHNKIKEFKNIIEKNPNLDYCVIYCAPSKGDKSRDQIISVQNILNEYSITNYKIKSEELDFSEIVDVMEKFESGLIKVVESIQIFDEGLDIPQIKNAILLSSTGNPKQFIQRRGRVLRKWSGVYPDGSTKTHATIHDILVIPYLNSDVDPEVLKTEREIVKKELARHEEMASISRNPNFGIDKIYEIKKKFGII